YKNSIKNTNSTIYGIETTKTKLPPDQTANLTIAKGYGSGQNSFKGNIAEIIVYKEALTDSQRIAVENYLKAKWGIFACSIITSNGYNAGIQYGDPTNGSGSVACRNGYSGGPINYTCNIAGVASGISGTCTPYVCNGGVPNGVGYAGLSSASGDGTISCSNGYSGNINYYCNSSGNAVISGSCTANVCSATLTGGVSGFNSASNKASGNNCNTILSPLQCPDGYVKQLSTTNCDANGNLICSGSSVEIANCNLATCTTKLNNGSLLLNKTTGESCNAIFSSLTCNNGYRKPTNFSSNCDANGNLVCQATGETSIGDCLINSCTITNIASNPATHGATVTCANGYNASSGGALIANCPTHNDAGSLAGNITCQENNCTAKLTNGSSNTNIKTNDSYVEIFKNLTCNKGYGKPLNSSLVGFAVCNSASEEKILGDCSPKTCAIALANGSTFSANDNGDALQTDSDYVSNFAKLTCNNGYQTPVSNLANCNSASANDACLDNGKLNCANGNQTFIVGSCSALTCQIPNIVNTASSQYIAPYTTLNHNSTVYCTNGYNPTSASLKASCLGDGSGVLNGGNCIKNRCYVSLTNGISASASTYETGDSLNNLIKFSEIFCNSGYYKPSSLSGNLNCSTYLGNVNIGSCLPNSCSASLTNGNNNITENHNTSCDTILANLTCPAGYNKSTTANCATLNCPTANSNIEIGSCTANTCNVSAGVGYDGINNITGSGVIDCNPGYTGNITYSCDSSAVSEATITGSCAPISCTVSVIDADVLNIALQTDNSVSSANSKTYSCKAGYSGSVQASCLAGVISYSGGCSNVVCTASASLVNGEITNPSNSSAYRLNNGQYTANLNYTNSPISVANNNIICNNQSGYGGTPAYTCSSDSTLVLSGCSLNKCQINSTAGYDIASTIYLDHNTSSSAINCATGYYKNQNNNTYTCQNNNLNGNVLNITPNHCNINICQINPISGYNIDSPIVLNYNQTSSAISCASGYSGTATPYTCNNTTIDGSTNNIAPTHCLINTCKVSLQNGSTTTNSYSHQTPLATILNDLSCNSGYTKPTNLVGNLTCTTNGSNVQIGSCISNTSCTANSSQINGTITNWGSYKLKNNSNQAFLNQALTENSTTNIECNTGYNGTPKYTCTGTSPNNVLTLKGCYPNTASSGSPQLTPSLWLEAKDNPIAAFGSVPSDGTAIGSWTSQSPDALGGNPIAVIQPTATSQPRYVSSSATFNNKPVIQFNNGTSGQSLVANSLNINSLLGNSSGDKTDTTIFLVQKVDTLSNSNSFSWYNSNNQRFNTHAYWTDNNLYFDFGICCEATGRSVKSNTSNALNPNIISYVKSSGGTTIHQSSVLFNDNTRSFTNSAHTLAITQNT
ncbi:MAG: hypothetical protein EBT55_04495, partial [Proteobacteria bacterium]|nr:hypothetical protein [Pseudomonadota bacterium]